MRRDSGLDNDERESEEEKEGVIHQDTLGRWKQE